MKNIIKTFLLVLAGLQMSACSKVTPAEQLHEAAGKCTLTVNVGALSTKTTAMSSVAEEKVNSLQVYVYDSSGAIEYYGKIEDASSLTFEVVPGEKTICALVNAASNSDIPTKNKFLAYPTLLSENSLTNFVMAGTESKEITKAETITIPVSRIASKIILNKITTRYSSASMNGTTKIKSVYLVNVPVSSTLLSDNYNISEWVNMTKFVSSSCNSFVSESNVDYDISGNGSNTDVHWFYSYPNPTTEDSSSSTWCARKTRLVVETEYGGQTYYYPITLPVLQRNYKYVITELIITRLGSKDPDVPVSMKECKFDLEIVKWQNGLTDYTETI